MSDESQMSSPSLEGYGGLDPLAKFGKFLMENLRDEIIHYYDMTMEARWAKNDPNSLQARIQALNLTQEQRLALRECMIGAADGGIHSFLFKLQEQADFENSIQIMVDGENVEELSDGIHAESFGEEGWIATFSKHENIEA